MDSIFDGHDFELLKSCRDTAIAESSKWRDLYGQYLQFLRDDFQYRQQRAAVTDEKNKAIEQRVADRQRLGLSKTCSLETLEKELAKEAKGLR